MSEPVATPITAKQAEAAKPPQPTPKQDGYTQVPTEVEPPYSEYKKKNGKPYSVDYFELGRYWDHGELYNKEIDSIESYISHQVEIGEINNTLDSVKKAMKKIEKMINLDKEDRKASRVGRVAAYMEFLIKADGIKRDAAKYGMS